MATQQNPAYYLNENFHEVGRGFRVDIRGAGGRGGVCACVNMINIHTYIHTTYTRTHTYIYISQSIAKNILKKPSWIYGEKYKILAFFCLSFIFFW